MSALGEAAGSRICRITTSVKVQTFMGTGAVPSTETREKFPVLVRVTAAAAEEQMISGAGGVDVVAMLDVGSSMSSDKLKRVKGAMNTIINKLGTEDRLSIVSFGGDDVRREMELARMSDQGRNDAKGVVKRLPTQGGASSVGTPRVPPALHEGAEILRERQDDKKSSRVGCIVLLSDGLGTQILDDDASISSDFPVHTLGLGADHDPKALKHIADKTSGTYSFANNDLGKIKDACALFTSIPATSVEITLRAHEGALISSSEKSSSDDGDGRSVAIRIGNMYAGEKKNFIVYLALETTGGGRQKLLTIGGRYQNLSESKNLADADVSVMRPNEKSSKTVQEAVLRVPDVAAVLAKIKMIFMFISGLVPRPITVMTTTQGITSKLRQILENIKEEGYQNMTRGINNFDQCKVSVLGLPYRLSWPRNLKWWRATTKSEPESPKTGDVVLTPRQEAEGIVHDGNNGNNNTTWENIRARARSHPCSRLRPGVAVALVLTSLLMMMPYSRFEGSFMAKGIAQLKYPILLFSKSNYADWDANKTIDSNNQEMKLPLSGEEKTDKPAPWTTAEKATGESSSPGQGCCRDNADDDDASYKCGECHGRDHDAYRESDLVAKRSWILSSPVSRGRKTS